MLRDILRNIALTYFPPKISFKINVWKNIELSYLEAEMPYIEKILNGIKDNDSKPVSVDIGANLGLFAYLLSRNSENVIAIEPQPKLAAYLKKVLPANVSILNLAISDHAGSAKMLIPKVRGLTGNSAQQDALATIEVSNPIMMQSHSDIIKVPIKTLDEILETQPRIDFIKIDVEGHELSVLNGSKSTLSNLKPIFMIELFKAHNPKVLDCFQLMLDYGYTCFYCASHGLVLCPTLDSASEIIDNPTLLDRTISNYFFIPLEKKSLIKKLFPDIE